MKKLFVIILIMSMVMGLSSAMCWAADNHGADAQSKSMSAESGEEPIPDESVTREAGGGEVIDAEPSEDVAEETPEEMLENVSEEVTDEKSGGLKEATQSNNLKYYVIGGAALLVLIVVIAATAANKRRNTYHSRH